MESDERMSARVVTEVLQNTRSVTLTVLGLSEHQSVRLRLDPANGRALVELGSVESLWPCLLPESVDWSAAVQVSNGVDHTCLRIAMRPLGPTESVLLGPQAALLGTELPRLQQVNNNVVCRACGQQFVTGAPFNRVLRLPSAYWQELAELWGCHTERFEAAPNEAIVIKPGDFYLGPSFMAVHASHVKHVTELSDGRLRCEKCNVFIGRRAEQQGKSTIPADLRLHLHAVDNGRGLWNDRTACARLAAELVELANGSGEHRFVTRTNLRFVCMNWETVLAVEPMVAPRPILKLTFGDEDDELGGWIQLSWNEDECILFARELEENRKRWLAPSLSDLAGRKFSFVWM